MNPETNMPAREISLYDIENICNDCGYRDEFTDVCPQCGSKNIKYGYGKDTIPENQSLLHHRRHGNHIHVSSA